MTDTRTETSLQAGLKKSTFHLFLATGAWVASTALMSFGPNVLWDFDAAVTFLAIAANLIAGGFMLYSFFRHLKNMDELQRQTHLEASINPRNNHGANCDLWCTPASQLNDSRPTSQRLIRHRYLLHSVSNNPVVTAHKRMKNRLKVLRADRDWTQADLADRLNVTRQTINAIEKGKYDPSLPLAFKIAVLFGLPIEEIFSPETD